VNGLLRWGRAAEIKPMAFCWPAFIIIPGLLFFIPARLGGKRAGALAIPGSILTMTGLLVLYQSTFNHWESWAYAWALLPAAVGAGLFIHGTWHDDPTPRHNGMRLVGIGLILFLVFGTFFELLLNISDNIVCGTALPVLLIVVGAYWLIARRGKDFRGGRRRLNDR
jgi:hypothetical protein